MYWCICFSELSVLCEIITMQHREVRHYYFRRGSKAVGPNETTYVWDQHTVLATMATVCSPAITMLAKVVTWFLYSKVW